MIFPAMKTGKLNIITGAMARELLTDGSGKVTAVSYVDKATRSEKQIRCRAVVVAASACESARLLLNSKSSQFPNGLANGSGQVGRNLTDTVGYALSGHVPALEGMPRHNCDGIGGMHVYVPWWELDKKNKDFPRGYHIEIGGGFGMPQIGTFRGVAREPGRLRHAAQGRDPPAVRRARQLLRPRRDDPQRTFLLRDRPHARSISGASRCCASTSHGANTKSTGEAHAPDVHRIIETMGGRVTGASRSGGRRQGISVGGSIIHEAGTVRDGRRSQDVRAQQISQAHEVKNLFVCDAAPFSGNPDKNVTLTIVAIAWRASEYLAEEMRKGNV